MGLAIVSTPSPLFSLDIFLSVPVYPPLRTRLHHSLRLTTYAPPDPSIVTAVLVSLASCLCQLLPLC